LAQLEEGGSSIHTCIGLGPPRVYWFQKQAASLQIERCMLTEATLSEIEVGDVDKTVVWVGVRGTTKDAVLLLHRVCVCVCVCVCVPDLVAI
jgi:hypothetical protein